MSKLAFIFPGQGSQKLGMLSAIETETNIVNDTFVEASDALGEDLWKICQFDSEKLNQTEYTQPILLTSSVALWRVWCDQTGPKPAMMAGHSLGEYSALVCANSINFADAINLVAARGRFMQSAVPAGTGGMAAILGLDDQQVVDACAKASDGDIVQAVNFNCPGQVVIAGHQAAVERAIELCKEAGAKRAMPLPVSVPSHCDLMQPAAEKLQEMLASVTIKAPEIKILHNVDVAPHEDANAIRKALVSQLYKPVRWTETIQTMAQSGLQSFVECGPGRVLAGLQKRIAPDTQALNFDSIETLTAAIAAIQ